MVGLLLFLMALLPSGERFSLSKQNEEWVLPTAAYGTALVVLMAGYTAHSLHQMGCLCGLENPDVFGHLPFSVPEQSSLPPSIAPFVVWSFLGIQLLALPMMLFRATRRWIWLALFLLQWATLFGLGAPQGTGAFLVLHIFTFNRDWLPPVSKPDGPSIVFFDGVCGLCNRAVDVILEEDIYHRYSFAPVQGETAADIDDDTVRSGQSMALQEDGTLYTKSDAVLRIAAGLGGLWRVFSWVRILPRPLRNGVYFLVQKSRYQVFGKHETCRLPTPEERRLFLP